MQKVERGLKTLGGHLLRAARLPTSTVVSPELALGTWLRQLRQGGLPPVRGHVAVLAIRNITWVEWAVYAACWMRRLGLAPVIVHSGSEIARLSAPANSGQPRLLRLLARGYWDLLGRLPDAEFVDLDRQPQPTQEQMAPYADFARDFAHTVAAYDLHVEEHEEGPLAPQYLQRVTQEEQNLACWAARAEGTFRDLDQRLGVRRLIAYSGLIGASSAFGQAARRVGWDVAFVEGWGIKPGHMLCNLNAPALDYNIPRWMKAMGDWNGQWQDQIKQFLAFQETPDTAGAEWLQSYHRFQRSSADQKLDGPLKAFLDDPRPMLLLAPNVVGDSATLRCATVFASQRQWIRQVCEYFRQHPQFRLLVRAHPDEEFCRARVAVPMGEVALEAARGADNIHVLTGSADVSTYALVPHARAGLVWLSTVGVDMVVRNCPVLAAARPKYHGLGIVLEPSTPEEYFAALERLAQTPTQPSPQQQETGRKYLAIIAREFSYQAFGPQFRGRDIHLTGHPDDGDFQTFYRILAGDLPPQTRPPSRRSA